MKTINMKCSALLSTWATGKRVSSWILKPLPLLTEIRHDDGHYVAARKILGRWYCIDDHNITLISDEFLPMFDQGQLFFLRRVE